MTLAELKAKAAELGLTPDDVRQHGSLSKKATWEAAITEFQQWKESVVECAVNYTPQDENPYILSYLPNETEETEEQPQTETEELETEPTPEPEPVPSNAIIPFRPNLSEIAKPDNSGYLVWNEKLQNWVKEKPSEYSTPIRDKLLAKMMGYCGKGISLADLEEMQKSSPDEKTAAIYLAILEESERLLIEAVAA